MWLVLVLWLYAVDFSGEVVEVEYLLLWHPVFCEGAVSDVTVHGFHYASRGFGCSDVDGFGEGVGVCWNTCCVGNNVDVVAVAYIELD